MNLPFQWKLSSLVRGTYIFFSIVLFIHIYQLTQSYLKVKKDFMDVHHDLISLFKEKLEPQVVNDPKICELEKVKSLPCPTCEAFLNEHLGKYKHLGLNTRYEFFNDKPTVRFQWLSQISLIPNREAYYEIHFNREALCQK